MNKPLFLSLIAAGVVAFAGAAQAAPMTGSGETSMTPTTTNGNGPQKKASTTGMQKAMPAETGSGETSMTPTTKSMGASHVRTRKAKSVRKQAGAKETGSGETSMTPTTRN